MMKEVFLPSQQGQALVNGIPVPIGIACITATAGAGAAFVNVIPGTVLRLLVAHATQYVCVTFSQQNLLNATLNDLIVPPNFREVYVMVPNNCFSMSFIASGAATPFNIAQGV